MPDPLVTVSAKFTTDGHIARRATVVSIDPELGVAVCRDEDSDELFAELVQHIELKWSRRSGLYDARRPRTFDRMEAVRGQGGAL